MKVLSSYSLGVGDRFAQQGSAQLRACQLARGRGVEVTPVWNKSHREHVIIGTRPGETRRAADEAVRAVGWNGPYFLDADHINMGNLEAFLEPCDFFTIDVAEEIGKEASPVAIDAFCARHPELNGRIELPGLEQPLQAKADEVKRIACKYLAAVQQASRIYRAIANAKGVGNFITEVSMDETDSPQTPLELLVVLVALADAEIPLQTVAPKFSGRFNKGVEYVGDPKRFEEEFVADLGVIRLAVAEYGLPPSLKLSVHSGSDKFSIYRPIGRALKRFGAGVHLKTAGTTWLEELIGLAEAGGEGLKTAQQVYREAWQQREALCAPYATVIDIDPEGLPSPEEVDSWGSDQYVKALRHDSSCPDYNLNLRQLLHVGYKVAAKMGPHFLAMVKECEGTVSRNVTENLYERHLVPLLLESDE